MGRRWSYLFALLSCLTTCRLSAQIKANAAFDPVRVEAGDTFSLRVLVAGAPVAPKRVSFAAWQQILPDKNILSRSEWSRSGTQWVKQFTLITFDSAHLSLPPLTVQLHLGDTVQTNPLELLVTAPRAASELSDMDPIRDIQREPTHWSDYWPWALGLAIALALVNWYFRRNRRRALPAPVAVPLSPPPLSPQEIALQKLAALDKQKPWVKGPILAYYAELSMIVREYLESRYGILALESTTREIAQLLKKTDFPENQKPVLEALLQQADLVKYAEMQPPQNYHEQALEKAKNLIIEAPI